MRKMALIVAVTILVSGCIAQLNFGGNANAIVLTNASDYQVMVRCDGEPIKDARNQPRLFQPGNGYTYFGQTTSAQPFWITITVDAYDNERKFMGSVARQYDISPKGGGRSSVSWIIKNYDFQTSR